MIHKDIFTKLSVQDNISGESLPFGKRIDAVREAIYSYNRDYPVSDIMLNPEQFDFSGRFDTDIDGLRLQCLFVNGSSNSLHVSFDGARSPNRVRKDQGNTQPIFPRWSYYSLYDGCFCGFDDPMYLKHKDLQIAWYYGDREHCYIDHCIRLVRHICAQKCIPENRVTFCSSSAGGYAALLAAIAMPGTLSISINPQICLANYKQKMVQQFTRCTGIDLKAFDPLLRNNIARKISTESKSKHIIIVNVESNNDYNLHLSPLVKAMGVTLRYGLTVANNTLFWVYQAKGAPGAHTSFENKAMYCAIDHIARNFCADNFSMEENQKLALLVNEYWHDLYEFKRNAVSLVKTDEKTCSQIIIDDRKKIFTERVESVRNNICIPARDSLYSNIKFSILPYSQYTIMLSQVSSSDNTVDWFTIAFYNIEENYMIYSCDIPFSSDDKYYCSFLTGSNVKNVKFIIYAGIIKKTFRIALSIGNMTIYRKDI